MIMKLIKTKAKEIFTKTKLPGCDLVVNQYVGCEHACLYCYAKFIARWRPADYGKWGDWVEAKMNAPELVKGKHVDGLVYMSSISDPYQPIEKELKLTRKVLENLDRNTNLSIQTKSDLVLRDLDILKEFKNVEVGFTINSFSKEQKEIFEPAASSNEARAKALGILKDNGIRTFAFVSPIIPGLIDLRSVIKETKTLVDYYWFEYLNIRGAGSEFMRILKEHFPGSHEILMDKKKFSEFMAESKSIIVSKKVRIRGIERH